MNDDELDQWLRTRSDHLDEKIAAVVDVDERLRQVLETVAKDSHETDERSEHGSEAPVSRIFRKRRRPIRNRTSTFATVAACVLLGLTVLMPSHSGSIPGTDHTSTEQRASDEYRIDFTTTCARPAENPECLAQVAIALRLAEASSTGDVMLRSRLKGQPNANTRPLGEGPWPFVVIDTDEAGLYARSTNSADGPRVGIAVNRGIVWGDCVEVSGFEPSGLDHLNIADSTWLRVRWRHQSRPEGQGVSEPAETETAWMYRGYLAPLQQNGRIADCNGSSS